MFKSSQSTDIVENKRKDEWLKKGFLRESIYLDRPVKLYFILSEKSWGKYQYKNTEKELSVAITCFHRPNALSLNLDFDTSTVYPTFIEHMGKFYLSLMLFGERVISNTEQQQPGTNQSDDSHYQLIEPHRNVLANYQPGQVSS